jgi:hypothetical protein
VTGKGAGRDETEDGKGAQAKSGRGGKGRSAQAGPTAEVNALPWRRLLPRSFVLRAQKRRRLGGKGWEWVRVGQMKRVERKMETRRRVDSEWKTVVGERRREGGARPRRRRRSCNSREEAVARGVLGAKEKERRWRIRDVI